MSKSLNLLQVTKDKVLAYDIQILFGCSMKGSELIKKLLPDSTVVTDEPTVAEDGLDTLEAWLGGLSDE